jgi:nitrite reductase/ring-hydroxylating ferredoxin subunit
MAWTIATLSNDVSPHSPLGVTVGEREVALFRDADGVCRAVEDRCAHRRAPLAAGKITADGLIECPYHGWRYEGAGGACKAIPNLSRSERVPRNYRIAAYPCAESAGFVWIGDNADDAGTTPGDEALALFAKRMVREGGRLIAYPAVQYREALLNAPSAVLLVAGHLIVDNHRLGEPELSDRHVEVTYAVDQRRRRDSDKPALATADFPFSLEVRSVGQLDRVILRGPDDEIAASILLAAVPVADSLCRVVWRAEARDNAGIDMMLRDTLDAGALLNASKAAAPVALPHSAISILKGEMA